MPRYRSPVFPFVRPPELDGRAGRRWPVAIVGAGPVGLAAAIDLALAGIASVVIDESNVVSTGSRAICWSKRTLEIFDRLGVGDRMVAKGVTWKVGRLFHRDREVYAFDLLPEPGHKRPAFINLQQYYVEEYLIDRARDFPDLIELRFMSRVTDAGQDPDCAWVDVETPEGKYRLAADYVIACDGVRSTVRRSLGLDFIGRAFEERFLITDVEMAVEFPSERWFWFEPPFHDGQSALLHKQPDNIYRIDLQLGSGADPEEERRPERVIPRIRAMVGERPFEVDWISVYSFQCRRLARFVHDRVIFAGDSAHIVSPFGARGGNGGIQDVDNLCWKLATVLKGEGPPALLETYNTERVHGADENILNSARATSFMTPKSRMEHLFRDEVLALASTHPFARQLVNSGRLSRPCSLAGFSLGTAETSDLGGTMVPGAPCLDAPVRGANGEDGWLLDHLGGSFIALGFGALASTPPGVRGLTVGGSGDLQDPQGLLAARYDGAPSVVYLIRPDQHVAARFREPTVAEISRALARAQGSSNA
ncbi:FAD-dependent oxidoreductase [Hyphomicrobium sp. CS1BSMeth3]|uniref:FAD-dependent oxidoreductase n=1 Tax=Hyphomicrobium sp. CS1BSMeth3 TaxID=1892844 RepID=UPI0009302B5A|nr:FAD-dependent oxidoreductase [Hyphomicrobium sp. CS1BSMeth3]